MTATGAKATEAGASSRPAQMWGQTNWLHIEAEVKRLQVRIAKATREGRWGKVQAFDNLSHSFILEHIPMAKDVLRRWLQAGYIDEGTLFATRAGTPQGGIMTPTTMLQTT